MKLKELEELKKMLLKKKTELENRKVELAEKLKVSIHEASGSISSYPTHIGDVGSDAEQRERDFHLGENIGREIKRVNKALNKIDSKDYSVCEKCGKKIGFDRLKAIPHVEFCIKCGENS